ncbi:MAG: 4Fe-4S dicluster domain-containing protein [Muribaculaceae bacterium]|nr:4Fe-4S dicluster domain-containing protein [Muribaculaceae bacterium]
MIGEKTPPVSIPEVINSTQLDLYEGEYLGFVFPIYAWGVPPIVLKFIERLPQSIFERRYVWAVCTCGDETGNAMKQFAKAIKQVSGKSPQLTASLIMPNTYVLLPGFDVDTPQVAEDKLKRAPDRLREIAKMVKERPENYTSVHTGSVPALRSLVYPLFTRWGVNSAKWHVGDKCMTCGKCGQICPVGNISYDDSGRPIWHDNCLSCCACFHGCPTRAIDYGKATKNKSQYRLDSFNLKSEKRGK